MRARNIKPGFYKNEQLAECSFEARLLFPGLWMLADREGRLEYRPKRMKAEIFPFDNIDIPPLIAELSREGLVILYEVNGKEYLWIPCFLKHQTPHIKEKKSEIPPCQNEQSTSLAPDEHNASTSLAPDETGKGNSQHPLNPESLILNPEVISAPIVAAIAKKNGFSQGDFDLFWEAFDDKRGKSGAIKSWKSIKGMNASLLQEIVSGAKEYALLRKDMISKGATPKMAQGWLTDRRWEDELTTAQCGEIKCDRCEHNGHPKCKNKPDQKRIGCNYFREDAA